MSLNGFILEQVHFSQPPAITLNGDAHIRHTVGTDFTDPGVTATDPEDGTLGSDDITISYLQPSVVPGWLRRTLTPASSFGSRPTRGSSRMVGKTSRVTSTMPLHMATRKWNWLRTR